MWRFIVYYYRYYVAINVLLISIHWTNKQNHCLLCDSFVSNIVFWGWERPVYLFQLLILHIANFNNLVTALIGSADTLELHFILLIPKIVYVLCNYTIPNKDCLIDYTRWALSKCGLYGVSIMWVWFIWGEHQVAYMVCPSGGYGLYEVSIKWLIWCVHQVGMAYMRWASSGLYGVSIRWVWLIWGGHQVACMVCPSGGYGLYEVGIKWLVWCVHQGGMAYMRWASSGLYGVDIKWVWLGPSGNGCVCYLVLAWRWDVETGVC